MVCVHTYFIVFRVFPSHMYSRSTPCPNVKVNDEWGDPVHCENSDTCTYCHSRTEQQFHPEVSAYE